jgi:SpoIID/LytB domain protein
VHDRHLGRQTWSRLLVALAVTAAALAAPLGGAGTPAAAQERVIVVEGRGWGHGRGMSQHGALGYAVDHGWTWQQILAHYYSNTTEGSIPLDAMVTTRLTAVAGQDTIVWRPGGLLHTDATGDALAPAWRVRPVEGGYAVDRGENCAGPWVEAAVVPAAAVRVFAPDPHAGGDYRQLLGVCQAGGTRFYRGEIHAYRDGAGAHQTRNLVGMEQYLRGVVPRESPAGWASAGGGRGVNALAAQAVAARSYARAENRDPGRAMTCDTQACQVYSGAFWLPNGATEAQAMEDPRTDAAIAMTAGVIRLLGGAPARTEYSSSSGGWTAGGTFPAVQDHGDAVSGNRVHTWREEVRVSAIEAAWPQIGRFGSVEVLARNGLSHWGGRVTQLRLHGTAGSITITGNEFRSRLAPVGACMPVPNRAPQACVKSDWFNVVQLTTRAVGVVASSTGGYWVTSEAGEVVPRGGTGFLGSMAGHRLNAPVLGLAATPAGDGYWLVAADGGIFSFGSARFWGSTGGMRLNRPVVGMAANPAGDGYWLVASDGGIFAFGAPFHGSTGAMRLNQPVVGMAAHPAGHGYWLVARDGGIFAFGVAFHGSTGALRLNQPIVGMAPTRTGGGYWLVARDGGVFAFGDARFHGSLPGRGVAAEAVGIAPSRGGNGYWIVTSDGTAHPFGDAGG